MKFRKFLVLPEPMTVWTFCGVIVAASALIFTVLEIRRLEELDHLKVDPQLRWFARSDRHEGFTVTLNNYGLGPARVKWIQVYREENLVENATELFAEMVKHHFPKGQKIFINHGSLMIQDESIIPATGLRSEVKFLEVVDTELAPILFKEHQNNLLFVCYCSLLGRCRIEMDAVPEKLTDTVSKSLPECTSDTRYPSYFRHH